MESPVRPPPRYPAAGPTPARTRRRRTRTRARAGFLGGVPWLPPEVGARSVGPHDRHPGGDVDPPGVGRLQAQPPGQRDDPADQPERHPDRAEHPERPRHPRRVEHGRRGDVERPAGPPVDRAPERIGEVVGVHGLEHERQRQRQDREPQRAHDRHRHEVAEEQPPELGRRAALEHESGAEPGHDDVGVLGLEPVHRGLVLGLVDRVRRGRDARRGEGLVDRGPLAVGVDATVGTDARRHDDLPDSRAGDGCEDVGRPGDVRPVLRGDVVRRLQRPCQVHDGVRALEHGGQLVDRARAADVHHVPERDVVRCDLRIGQPPRDPDDLQRAAVTGPLQPGGSQPTQHAGPDVAGGPDDDDPHQRTDPRRADRTDTGRACIRLRPSTGRARP